MKSEVAQFHERGRGDDGAEGKRRVRSWEREGKDREEFFLGKRCYSGYNGCSIPSYKSHSRINTTSPLTSWKLKMTPKKVNHNSKTGKLRDGAQALGPAAKTTYLLDSLASVNTLPGYRASYKRTFLITQRGYVWRYVAINRWRHAPVRRSGPPRFHRLKSQSVQQVHALFAVV